MLPLHKDGQQASKGLASHAGLWYDRFFNQYDKDCNIADEGKLKWINTVTASRTGDPKVLKSHANRQQAMILACEGKALMMTTDWHFVTGLGNNHPVENGFAWHHTLGVPYLTGAAVKGMVRAWCEVWQEFDAIKQQQWFGDAEQSGGLIFFDAIPTEPVQLKADIMTPHYGDWYAKGDEDTKRDGSNVPADWHDPVPVPFLVVDKGASFQFAVGKRAGSSIDLSEVVEALQHALQWLGAGAKNAAGYGRFVVDEKAEAKQEQDKQDRAELARKAQVLAEQEARRTSMTPLQAILDKWITSNPEPNTVDQWLAGLEDKSVEEKKQIATVLQTYYEDRGTWKKPSKKQKLKVQSIKAILSL